MALYDGCSHRLVPKGYIIMKDTVVFYVTFRLFVRLQYIL